MFDRVFQARGASGRRSPGAGTPSPVHVDANIDGVQILSSVLLMDAYFLLVNCWIFLFMLVSISPLNEFHHLGRWTLAYLNCSTRLPWQWPVWPDGAIYGSLGDFFKPLITKYIGQFLKRGQNLSIFNVTTDLAIFGRHFTQTCWSHWWHWHWANKFNYSWIDFCIDKE